MSATYPLAVRTFTQKRNLLDDVDASHVNDIQDEIKALETVLGVMPHVDKVTKASYASVAARLDALSQADIGAIFALQQNATFNASTGPWPANAPGDVVPVKAGYDTGGLANGTGATIKTSGYYDLRVSSLFGASGIPGRRVVTLLVSNGTGPYGRYTFADAPVNPVAASSEGLAHASYITRLNAGMKVAVGVIIDNGGTVKGKVPVYYTRLHGFMLRSV